MYTLLVLFYLERHNSLDISSIYNELVNNFFYKEITHKICIEMSQLKKKYYY